MVVRRLDGVRNFLGRGIFQTTSSAVLVFGCRVRDVLAAFAAMVAKIILFILMSAKCLANPLVATNKLSLATWGSYFQRDHMGPGTYAFGYDIEDPVTGNVQFRQEERHPNGTVSGSYGYVDANGRPYVVTYVADENGYRAKLEVEGELTKYFPEVSTFSENIIRHQSDPYGTNHALQSVRTDSSEELKNSETVNGQWLGVPLPLWRLERR